MTPFQTFRVIGCAILIAIVLTVVLFPWLEAGHASPVIFLVPGLLVSYLLCGPGLRKLRYDRRARFFAALIAGLVFFALAMAAGRELL